MAMHESEAFWQEFLRRPSAQRAVQLEQKVMMRETALDLKEKEIKEKEQIAEALAVCDPEVRQLAEQMHSSARVKRLLFRLLRESNFDKNTFSKLLAQDQPAYKQLVLLREELLEASAACDAQLQQVREQCETAVGLSTYQQIKPKTWEDLPEEELAERLCKGEICPRDEWIPGISKDKRPLDSKALQQHLQLGKVMLSDGRTAYAKESYETALMRFTQGVQLLNWVRAADSEEQHLIDDMYLIFLRNQAQSALKLEKYQECLRACTTIIQDIDEHDAKARYRRAKAYMLLGLIKSAKDDLIFMIKSPFMEPGAVIAARAALADIRRIVNKSELQARQTMLKSVQVFSENRVTGSENHSNPDCSANNADRAKRVFFRGGAMGAVDAGKQLDSEGDNHRAFHDKTTFSSSETLASDACDKQSTKRQFGKGSKSKRRDRWFQNDAENESPSVDTHENELLREADQQSPFSETDAGLPPLDREQTKLLLIDLLEVYTAPENQAQLHQMARDADFEVRRFLVRAKKFLPRLQEEVFDRHKVPGASHRIRLRTMERSVGFWRSEDEEIDSLRQECWAAVFGDVLDID